MSLRIQCVCIDSHDPSRIAGFWESALGWRRTYEKENEVAFGAKHISLGQARDSSWIVLADPDGNEFCVLKPLVP